MTIEQSIQLIKDKGLTPLDPKFEGDSFDCGVGYIAIEEIVGVYFINGKRYLNIKNFPYHESSSRNGGLVQLMFKSKEVMYLMTYSEEFIKDSNNLVIQLQNIKKQGIDYENEAKI